MKHTTGVTLTYTSLAPGLDHWHQNISHKQIIINHLTCLVKKYVQTSHTVRCHSQVCPLG